MNITVAYENLIYQSDDYETIITQVCNEVAQVYGLTEDQEISILLCHNEYIHQLNNTYRHIDRPTDVLSFALNEGEAKNYEGPEKNLLGDIVISLEKVEEQAKEFGHPFSRELAYLTVHGMLHILGYDHMTDEDKLEMRKEEEFVLNQLGIVRLGESL